MKKIAMIMAAAAMTLFIGCNKGGNAPEGSEVGKWYGFNAPEDKTDVAYVLDLKEDKSADFIISAWGERYQGTYTYDGEVITITYTAILSRPNAWDYQEEYGESPCAPENLYKHWSEAVPASGTKEIAFTYTGNTGLIDVANKPCYAERQ